MLINCVVYEEGRKLADIPVEDIDQWLQRPGCFVWVALRDASDDELRQMQHEFDLHELALEDMLNTVVRQVAFYRFERTTNCSPVRSRSSPA